MMNREVTGGIFRALIGSSILVIACLGSILAANIAIGNSSQPREYGQGVFNIKACDTWIQMDLVNGATGQFGAPSGYSALTGITIQGLDESQCKSTQFLIKAINTSNQVLPIYRTDKKAQMCTVNPTCTIGKNAESDLIVTVSSKASVALYGTDSFHSMSYRSSNGVYTITFAQPGQLALDVANLTIQSSSI